MQIPRLPHNLQAIKTGQPQVGNQESWLKFLHQAERLQPVTGLAKNLGHIALLGNNPYPRPDNRDFIGNDKCYWHSVKSKTTNCKLQSHLQYNTPIRSTLQN